MEKPNKAQPTPAQKRSWAWERDQIDWDYRKGRFDKQKRDGLLALLDAEIAAFGAP